MIFSKRSHRLHRWVPLVLTQNHISFKWNGSQTKTVAQVFTLYEMPTAIFVCMMCEYVFFWVFALSVSLLSYSHFLLVSSFVCVCLEVKCNLMLICVASCISKKCEDDNFSVSKPYFRCDHCGISWSDSFNRIQYTLTHKANPFECHILHWMQFPFEIVTLNRPKMPDYSLLFIAHLLFACRRLCNTRNGKNWKITWHLINELV